MTRAGVRSLIARLEDPWELGAQVMAGRGLRLMEAMRLRVKDLDFGQGTITIRNRHPDRSKSSWSCRCLHHHDLPPRHETPRRGRSQPHG